MKGAKLYIPSTLNIDLTLWHTQLIVFAENVKSWFKSWVFPFTFQASILPHTINCMCLSLFEFHTWIFEHFLVLPKTAGSAQTQKSMSFIWIVWSTLYVYLWKGAGTCSHGKWPTDQTKTHGVYLDLHLPNKNTNNNLAHGIQKQIPKLRILICFPHKICCSFWSSYAICLLTTNVTNSSLSQISRPLDVRNDQNLQRYHRELETGPYCPRFSSLVRINSCIQYLSRRVGCRHFLSFSYPDLP